MRYQHCSGFPLAYIYSKSLPLMIAFFSQPCPHLTNISLNKIVITVLTELCTLSASFCAKIGFPLDKQSTIKAENVHFAQKVLNASEKLQQL